MSSIHIEQGPGGPYVEVSAGQAAEVRKALFQACIRFQELPAESGWVQFHFEESTPRSTLYRALEAVS